MTNLYTKLLKEWKDILKNWEAKNQEKKTKTILKSSIEKVEENIIDIVHKQKTMLCDMSKFDCVEFARLMLSLNEEKQN